LQHPHFDNTAANTVAAQRQRYVHIIPLFLLFLLLRSLSPTLLAPFNEYLHVTVAGKQRDSWSGEHIDGKCSHKLGSNAYLSALFSSVLKCELWVPGENADACSKWQ
jgi:hypothetical protein